MIFQKVVFISIIFLSVSCNQCNNLPSSYDSYSQAKRAITFSYGWKISESNPTSESSWMRGAKYYSCDGRTGYLVYNTNTGNKYIHQGVPNLVWKKFDKAISKGAYYNQNIKGKFQLNLKN